MKKLICIFLVVVAMVCCLAGCEVGSQSYNVNQNLNQAANNFECLRRITVYNARTDLIVLELEGYMSLSNTSTGELVVTCKTGENEYKKNYVYLNDYTLYVVEDITGTVTDPYHYKVHFYVALPDIEVNE
jgi:hypothetical protein